MTYRRFHATFTLPIIIAECICAWLLGMPYDTWYYITPIVLIAIIFTYPWDSWAIRQRIWEFNDAKVWFRVGNVPIEEIAFFVIQTVMVGLGTYITGAILPGSSSEPTNISTSSTILFGGVATGWVLIIVLGAKLWGRHTRYVRHLLFWFCPVISLLYCLFASIIINHKYSVILPTTIFGIYLSVVDFVAIKRGIWFFDEEQTMKIKVAGVPVEEIAFFLLTSLLVSMSTLLLLPENYR